MKTTIILMLVTVIVFGFSANLTSAQTDESNVVFNKTRLSEAFLSAFEKKYGVRIPDGDYWYDAKAGAWGLEGGPTLGFTRAGLKLGGPLRADASNGNTSVFINGRELHYYDVLSLQQLVGLVLPGRYWVDSNGYFGYEGGWALGNLVQIASARNNSGGGSGGFGSVIGDGKGCVGFTDHDVTIAGSGC